jgi:hypothetical protein
VHEYVKVEMVNYDSTCSDAGEWHIPFRITQGRSCASYSLAWKEQNTGLQEADHEDLPEDNIIHVLIPSGIIPNYYHAHFTFHDSLRYINPETIKDATEDVTLALLYPEEVITQRWNDVLAIRNAEYNGGFTFDSVQWYVGNVPIEGARSFNYYAGENGKLRMDEAYTALLWRNDGVALFTCPFVPEIKDYNPMPTLVPLSSPMNIKGKGTAYWYDMTGRIHHRESYHDSDIYAPNSLGYYLLVLQSADERTIHPIIVR